MTFSRKTPGRLLALATAILALSAAEAPAATVPDPVIQAVHGRVVGWAKSGTDWFVVYVDGKGTDWCGLGGAATWRMALIRTAQPLEQVVDDRRIGGSMCGNSLAWTRAGHFSDGRHQDVAFMLWQTPSIGASTYLYRIDGNRLRLLGKFAGDVVVLGRGTVKVYFENRGRSAHGEIEDIYRFANGHYRLASRR